MLPLLHIWSGVSNGVIFLSTVRSCNVPMCLRSWVESLVSQTSGARTSGTVRCERGEGRLWSSSVFSGDPGTVERTCSVCCSWQNTEVLASPKTGTVKVHSNGLNVPDKMRCQCVDLSVKDYLTRRNDPIEPRRASGDQTAAQQAAVVVQHPHSDMLESIHRCEAKRPQFYLTSERSVCEPTEPFQNV